jgi:hypothetical protein
MPSEDLLPGMPRAEVVYAEIKRKIDDLSYQYCAEEQRARAELTDKSAAIVAKVETQRAELPAQMDRVLREEIEKALRQIRNFETEALR